MFLNKTKRTPSDAGIPSRSSYCYRLVRFLLSYLCAVLFLLLASYCHAADDSMLRVQYMGRASCFQFEGASGALTETVKGKPDFTYCKPTNTVPQKSPMYTLSFSNSTTPNGNNELTPVYKHLCVDGKLLLWDGSPSSEAVFFSDAPSQWYSDIFTQGYGTAMDVSFPWPCVELSKAFVVLQFCDECHTLHGVLSLYENTILHGVYTAEKVRLHGGGDFTLVFLPTAWFSLSFVRHAIERTQARHVVILQFSLLAFSIMQEMPGFNFSFIHWDALSSAASHNVEVVLPSLHSVGFEAGVLASLVSSSRSIAVVGEECLTDALDGARAGIQHYCPSCKVFMVSISGFSYDAEPISRDIAYVEYAIANADVVILADRHAPNSLSRVLEANSSIQKKIISIVRVASASADGFPPVVMSARATQGSIYNGVVASAGGFFRGGVRHINYLWVPGVVPMTSLQTMQFEHIKKAVDCGVIVPVYGALDTARGISQSPFVDVFGSSSGNAVRIAPSWIEEPIACHFHSRVILFSQDLSSAFMYNAETNQRVEIGFVFHYDAEDMETAASRTAVTARRYATCTRVTASSAIIHGGIDVKGNILNETFVVSVSGESTCGRRCCLSCTFPRVVRLPLYAPLNAPVVPPRYGHSCMYISNGRVEVYNGYTYSQDGMHVPAQSIFAIEIDPYNIPKLLRLSSLALQPGMSSIAQLGSGALEKGSGFCDTSGALSVPPFHLIFSGYLPFSSRIYGFDAITASVYVLEPTSTPRISQWKKVSVEPLANVSCVFVATPDKRMVALTSDVSGRMSVYFYRESTGEWIYSSGGPPPVSNEAPSMSPRTCVGMPSLHVAGGGALILPREGNDIEDMMLFEFPSVSPRCDKDQVVGWDYTKCNFCEPGFSASREGYCVQKVPLSNTWRIAVAVAVPAAGLLLIVAFTVYCCKRKRTDWSRACDPGCAPPPGDNPIAAVRICSSYLQQRGVACFGSFDGEWHDSNAQEDESVDGVEHFATAVDEFSKNVRHAVVANKCFLIRFTGDMAMFVAKNPHDVLLAVTELSIKLLECKSGPMRIQCGLHHAYVNWSPSSNVKNIRFVYSGVLAEECSTLMMASRTGVFVASSGFYTHIDPSILPRIGIATGDTYDLRISKTRETSPTGTQVRDLVVGVVTRFFHMDATGVAMSRSRRKLNHHGAIRQLETSDPPCRKMLLPPPLLSDATQSVLPPQVQAIVPTAPSKPASHIVHPVGETSRFPKIPFSAEHSSPLGALSFNHRGSDARLSQSAPDVRRVSYESVLSTRACTIKDECMMSRKTCGIEIDGSPHSSTNETSRLGVGTSSSSDNRGVSALKASMSAVCLLNSSQSPTTDAPTSPSLYRVLVDAVTPTTVASVSVLHSDVHGTPKSCDCSVPTCVCAQNPLTCRSHPESCCLHPAYKKGRGRSRWRSCKSRSDTLHDSQSDGDCGEAIVHGHPSSSLLILRASTHYPSKRALECHSPHPLMADSEHQALPVGGAPRVTIGVAQDRLRNGIWKEDYSQILSLATSVVTALLGKVHKTEGGKAVRSIIASRFQVPHLLRGVGTPQMAATALATRLLAIANVEQDVMGLTVVSRRRTAEEMRSGGELLRYATSRDEVPCEADFSECFVDHSAANDSMGIRSSKALPAQPSKIPPEEIMTSSVDSHSLLSSALPPGVAEMDMGANATTDGTGAFADASSTPGAVASVPEKPQSHNSDDASRAFPQLKQENLGNDFLCTMPEAVLVEVEAPMNNGPVPDTCEVPLVASKAHPDLVPEAISVAEPPRDEKTTSSCNLLPSTPPTISIGIGKQHRPNFPSRLPPIDPNAACPSFPQGD